MKKENYSWWEDSQNKEVFELPISVVKNGDWWVAACNEDTKKLLGDRLHGVSQGRTKQEAIEGVFESIRIIHDYSEDCMLNYQRFVPFRKGSWNRRGGEWFAFFGIHVYLRYGSNMQGGFYIPFTKLNVLITNEWTAYKAFKIRKKKL